jgi:hypothetical protein
VPSSYKRKALGKDRSAPILFFIWECLSSKPNKRVKRVEPLIGLWPAAFRNLSPPKRNEPLRTFKRSDRACLPSVRAKAVVVATPCLPRRSCAKADGSVWFICKGRGVRTAHTRPRRGMCLAPKARHSLSVRQRTDSPWRTWGAAPGGRARKAPALKAIHVRNQFVTGLKRAFSAWLWRPIGPWGVAPGLNMRRRLWR